MKALLILLLAALPLVAAERTLLFVDDHEIRYRPATRRVLHQPVRHQDNPLLIGPTPKHHHPRELNPFLKHP